MSLTPTTITVPPSTRTLWERGGGGVYTGPLATGPPSPIYAKHTTINGSRPGFIVVCIIAGLIFFTLLGGGYWWYRRRRQRLTSGGSRRYSTSTKRLSGMFSTRKSTSERDRNAGKWTTLGDQDDAFTTNVSMVDFTDMNEPSAYEYPRRWNPVYAASGESLSMGHDDDKKEGWEDRKSNTLNA